LHAASQLRMALITATCASGGRPVAIAIAVRDRQTRSRSRWGVRTSPFVIGVARKCIPLALVLACEQPTEVALASSAAPTTTSSVAPTASADASSCDELARVLVCMKAKAPAAERKGIEARKRKVDNQMRALGAESSRACRVALDEQRAMIDRVGCSGGEDRWQPPAVDYPSVGIKLIADKCAEPTVLLAMGPSTMSLSSEWPWVRQTMVAHPHFVVVDGTPSAAGEVAFAVIDGDKGLTLFARCRDADTCNRLAAMYKAVVRSSAPQTGCGQPKIEGDIITAFVLPADGDWLPAKGDAAAECARISACRISLDPHVKGDPGSECRRQPMKFDRGCARRDSCRAVVLCLDK
jgi:hypothetical protein